MSILTLGLLIAFIALFIWMKWDENHKWKTVYEASSTYLDDAQKRFGHLRQKGIRCRLKNHTPETLRTIGTQGNQPPNQTTTLLQVHKKDIDQAHKHLADHT